VIAMGSALCRDKVFDHLGGVYSVHIVAYAVSHDVNMLILWIGISFTISCHCNMPFIVLFVLKRHCSS
jgi:hypothetical protein